MPVVLLTPIIYRITLCLATLRRVALLEKVNQQLYPSAPQATIKAL